MKSVTALPVPCFNPAQAHRIEQARLFHGIEGDLFLGAAPEQLSPEPVQLVLQRRVVRLERLVGGGQRVVGGGQ